MKHLLPIILSILLLTACGENERNSQFLERAETIMNDSCDVALSMLQDSINPKTLTTERGRAIYAVLLSQALDKNYIDIASDSIIAPAVKYFADVTIEDDSQSVRYAMLTNFYLGRIKFNANDKGNSLIANLKAEEYGLAINDYFYLGLIYRNLAFLQNNSYNFEDELKYSKLSLENFKKSNIKSHYNWALLDLATSFNNNEQFNDAIKLFNRVIDIATNNCDSILLFNTISNYAHSSWLNNDTLSTKNQLIFLSKHDKLNAINCGHLAQIYANEHKIDSAKYFIDLGTSLIQNDIDKTAIEKGKYCLYISQNDLKNALYSENILSTIERNSVDSAWTQSIVKIHREYYKSLSIINKQTAKQRLLYIYFSIIGMCILILIIFLLFIYFRSKQTQNKLRILQLENIYLEQKQRSSEELDIVNARISTLKPLLSHYKNLSEARLTEIVSQRDELLKIKKRLEDAISNRKAIDSKFIDHKLIKNLYDKISSSKNLTAQEWQQLYEFINSIYPQFQQRLHNLCRISDTEYKICILIKCKLTPTEMSKLISLSKSGLGNARKRLYKKAFKEEGSATDWDNFILSL